MRFNEKNIIFIVSFFIFAGYYLGLSILFNSGQSSLSRFYSVPLRILLMLLMLYYLKENRNKLWNRNFANVLLFYFTILYVIKVLYTESINAPTAHSWFEYIFYYLSYSLLPFVFFSNVDFIKYKNIIIEAIVLSGFLLGIIMMIFFKNFLGASAVGRISNLTYQTGEAIISPIAIAYSGAITVLMCVYKLIYDKNSGIKLLYIILTLIVSFVIFFLGATRGALVAVFFGLISFIYFGNMKQRMLLIALSVIATPFILYGIEATGSAIFDRTLDSISTGDSSGREILWEEAIREFIKYPIVGGRIEVSGIYPHNLIIEVLMGTGLVGFVLFMSFLIILFKKGVALIKENHEFLIVFMLFVCGLSLHFFSSSITSAITLFSALGMFNSYKIFNENT